MIMNLLYSPDTRLLTLYYLVTSYLTQREDTFDIRTLDISCKVVHSKKELVSVYLVYIVLELLQVLLKSFVLDSGITPCCSKETLQQTYLIIQYSETKY